MSRCFDQPQIQVRRRRHGVARCRRHDFADQAENSVAKNGAAKAPRPGAGPRSDRAGSRRASQASIAASRRSESARGRFGRPCRRRSRPRRRARARSPVHRTRGPRSARSRSPLRRGTAGRGNFDNNRRSLRHAASPGSGPSGRPWLPAVLARGLRRSRSGAGPTRCRPRPPDRFACTGRVPRPPGKHRRASTRGMGL